MRRFIGLMSGTSIDAVDAVLLESLEGAGARRLRTAGFTSIPIDDALSAALHALQFPGPDELARAAHAGQVLADHYAAAVEALLARYRLSAGQVLAIGAHGQTVRHHPAQAYSLQLLDAARLAERCRIPVVCDLRAADLAAGGQGAPLVPAFHARVFGDPHERRVIVNLGGIGNVSILPATRDGAADGATADGVEAGVAARADDEAAADGSVTGFDTGPANTLLDAWYRRHHGAGFDNDGRWARSGTVHPALLARLLADPYFSRPAPKSTGRDHFHLAWLDRAIAGLTSDADDRNEKLAAAGLDPADVQATLVELSAHTIARACQAASAQAVYACGGGTRNGWLMERLRALLAPIPLDTTDTLGIAAQAVEAAAFAWLAMCRIDGRPGNLPAVTGARGLRVLGALVAPFPSNGSDQPESGKPHTDA